MKVLPTLFPYSAVWWLPSTLLLRAPEWCVDDARRLNALRLRDAAQVHGEAVVEEAAEGSLHPGAAVLGLWGASLLDMRMSTKQLDILARNAIVQDKKLAPRSLAKIVWALAALGYDPTPKDLAALKDRSAHAMPRLMAKDQEALREALARLGDVQITRA